MKKNNGIPVIDLFAGPGGLCEGFASLVRDGSREFDIRVSIEKDPVAHRTLSLRALFRSFPVGKIPESYYQYIRGEINRQQMENDPVVRPYLEKANNEAKCAELGKDDHRDIDQWIREGLGGAKDWVLIGGPPCQAYSLAGRSRMRSNNPEEFEADKRHLLYREYLRIIKEFSPSVFVMENVKGMLTSQHSGSRIFDRILSDLRDPHNGHKYLIRSFVVPGEIEDPSDFVIKSEELGIPQSRHRVILFGIREDVADSVPDLIQHPERFVVSSSPRVNTREVLSGLPALRSRLSNRSGGMSDSNENWQRALTNGLKILEKKRSAVSVEVLERARWAVAKSSTHESIGGRFIKSNISMSGHLAPWYLDQRIGGVTLHEARSHMESDLHRYLFASSFAREESKSPRLRDFPKALLPSHGNVWDESVPFEDRFRVQLRNQPSTTIVSHISKDGHYYIHPEPSQCRSLTVREAARLQTFPDNYFFEGNRTEQYHQVGNAVPPMLARKIGEIVLKLLKSVKR
ncbi:DNA (cytosine-5-)-methyltransferase [Limnohabitans sp. Rim8]|jgi:DNA (cytosine-5)-methyltransferase 1|uniref:DNA cytosine methyltransferase n=1 Tax=Limnohabitans sp. Rim8 TaxID=1100718 RepID=UPI000D36F013|nr:DNA cytosine methyltransferase [Limnohabitans sp. Rim8]PUE54655.1 DNA (cytosine-5-)-methyltransferase [Limnohabitans sp. Rim8]